MKTNDTLPEGAPVPGIYEHYKGPQYQVFGLARHSETESWLVVYQALYGERGLWVRPLELWLEPTTHGAQTRFKLIQAKDQSFGESAGNDS